MRGAVVVAALALATLGLLAQPATAQDADDGLIVDATSTYRLDPPAQLVQVTMELSLTNTMPSRVSTFYIETPYVDSFAIPTIGPVANAVARTSSGRELTVSVRAEEDGVSLVDVDLSPNLVHGAPQSIVVEFDLPGQPARSESVTRVNDAFASWFVFAPGDPGRIDIVFDLPESFHLSLSNSLHGLRGEVDQQDGRRIQRFDDLAHLDDALLVASARDDDRLVVREVSIGDAEVAVKAWPGDDAWAAFATETVERGLPALIELIGADLPEDELTVLESSASYHVGYAGFYVPELALIEVGDELDVHTLLHELTHVWFNDELFTQRWIYEGLAETISNRAAAQLDEESLPPDPIDPAAPGARPLNDWTEVFAFDDEDFAVEEFAYNASYAVVQQLADEIGDDGLRDVIAAALAGHIAYQGDGDPEKLRRLRDWRYLFDLLERVGGSERAEEVFVAHVLNDGQARMLDARAAALVVHDELVAAGGAWSAPLAVREKLARWEFGPAEERAAEAHAVLERVAALAAATSEVDADPSDAIEPEYESAGDLDELGALLDRYESVGDDLVELDARRRGANPIARIGLVGTEGLDGATAAYVSGDLDAAVTALAQIEALVDGATGRGALRLVALLLVLAAVGAHLRLRATRRRTSV